MEIWKDIEGFDGVYRISNFGRVWSAKKGILKTHTTQKGYKRASFKVNGKLIQSFVHRLVANAFIDRVNDEANEVNHKNGDKTDNSIANLEWCTSKYNAWHKYNILNYEVTQTTRSNISNSKKGVRLSDSTKRKMSNSHKGLKRSKESVEKMALANNKEIVQLDKDNNIIQVFNSLNQAHKTTKISKSNISQCANKKRNFAGGYRWDYTNNSKKWPLQ